MQEWIEGRADRRCVPFEGLASSSEEPRDPPSSYYLDGSNWCRLFHSASFASQNSVGLDSVDGRFVFHVLLELELNLVTNPSASDQRAVPSTKRFTTHSYYS